MEETKLLQEFKKGINKEKIFNLFLEKYKKKVYWHVRTIIIDHDDADDVVQNTFIKVWKYLDSFQEKSTFGTWIYRIATNEALTFIKKYKKNQEVKSQETSDYLLEKLSKEDGYSEKKTEWQLQKAIQTLPEQQKIIFLLRYYQDFSFKEISEVMETSENGLKSNYHHANKKIQKYLRDNF